ncbi:hypothetical protein GJ629_12875 [Halapricum sp. CBA1109]|uniref:hypothetical protein n=1 Tax=Halapricum sp. CBA1109 TaxID=2668068 RepID=UPI0012FCD8F0|nr:hypothetical protein [Halapricum sp. CBA1109]MUV90679.1 hypothetical protein [Halapricum sp. CBA1109]
MAVTPQFEFDHERRGSVVVQDLTDWDGTPDGMDAVEAEWLSIAERPHITGSVTVFDPGMALPADTLDRLARQWSDGAARVDIERIAFVAEGVDAHAVGEHLDMPHAVRTFESTPAAVEWAGE